MEHERRLAPSQQKLLEILKSYNGEYRTYKELTAESMLAHITVMRALKALQKLRLVSSYYDGVEVHWKIMDGDEIPTLGKYTLAEYLKLTMKDEWFTDSAKDWFKTNVALLYVQPAYKIAAGKPHPYLAERKEEILDLANYFETQAATLKFLGHTLYSSNEHDYDSWARSEDYDPTKALEILSVAMPKRFDDHNVKTILKKWRDKKVG